MIYEVVQYVNVVWRQKRVILTAGDLAIANEETDELSSIDRAGRRVAVMEADQLAYARRASPEAFKEFQPGKKGAEAEETAETREVEEPPKDRQVKAAAKSRSKKSGGAK